MNDYYDMDDEEFDYCEVCGAIITGFGEGFDCECWREEEENEDE